MFRWIHNRKGQNTAEYAILIGVIVAVAIAMQTYVKRGLSGRVREAVDHVGTGGDVGGADLNFSGQQYVPYYLETHLKTDQDTEVVESTAIGGAVKRESQREEIKRTGDEIHDIGRAAND